MKRFFFNEKQFFLFVITFAACFSLFILTGNYINTPIESFRDFIFVTFHWGIVSLGYLALVYGLALNKLIFSVFFPVLNIISAAAVYNIVLFDISVNTALIESVINTNPEEASAFLSFKFIIYLIFIFLLSVFFVYRRFKISKPQKIFFHIILITVFAAIPYSVNKIRYNTISQRVPFSIFSSVKKYKIQQNLLSRKRQQINTNTKCAGNSLTAVLVLGEAARADHLGLNGYLRETTPLLSKRNVLSFSKIYSQWTHTNKSLPHILTRADSSNTELAYTEKSLISIFKTCGFKTYWLGNQVPGDSYLPFIKNCDTVILNKPMRTVYNLSKKLDGDLLPHFNNFIDEKAKRKLIIVHLIGSHWFYPAHYSDEFEVFKPAIKGKTFNKADSLKVVNAYDNTILYTDFILNELIKKIEQENSFMIYLSDHGELLGEKNKWLHAQGTEFEKNPACIAWFSTKYLQKNEALIKQAKLRKSDKINTDFLFHSILHASEITNPKIDTMLSIFSGKP